MSESGIWQHLAERKTLDLELRTEIEKVFGTRGKNALAAIDDRKIKKYLDLYSFFWYNKGVKGKG